MELYFPIDNDEIQRKRPGPNFKVPVVPIRKRRGAQKEYPKPVVAGEEWKKKGLAEGFLKLPHKDVSIHMDRKPITYEKLKAQHKKGNIHLSTGLTSTHPHNVNATADMLRFEKEHGHDAGHKHGKVVPTIAEDSAGHKQVWAAGYHHSGKKNWFAE